jgi:EAL domain-containing protein (putative c-di-GMP-specific phosphodiesterase class I)
MGTGKLQGFLYSRPLPYDEVCQLIRERGWA